MDFSWVNMECGVSIILFEAIHVPLIISSPGMKKNIKSNSMVEYVDLYPTLCDIAGIEALNICMEKL